MALPRPPLLASASWRAANEDDAVVISNLQNACFEADGGYRVTPEEFANELGDPDVDLAADSRLAVTPDGQAVAFVLVQLPSSFESKARVFCWDLVHPEFRGNGVEEFLLEWYESRAVERAGMIDDGVPVVLWKGVYDWQRDQIERLENRGYEPMRYFMEMLRDLSRPIAAAEPPAGYAVVPWPDDSDPIRMLHNEAFKDHWGSEPRSADEWQRYQLDEFFRQDLSSVVTFGGEPVAYLHSAVYPHDFDDRGRTEAWVEILGTAREHRNRGLAKMLLARALATYRHEGFEFAAIGVDSESLTGAVRLYESIGFEVEKRSAAYGKRLR